jgi:phenylpropionate dioxygenase-like ring-hydroxylating dioxygenase large terminal subunit
MDTTLPWSWYTDPEVLRREQERIFRGTWQYVGHAGELPEPGMFLAARAGDVPVVLTRARDEELRAFLNVCRHRGSVVVDGNGKRESLQCPYHAWTYGLDGSLRAAPRADEGIDRESLGLVRLALERWGPFLFVNTDRNAAPLAQTLGPVSDALPMDGLRFHHRSEYAVDANWKIACENYLECYHCAVAHPGFSAVMDVSPGEYRLVEGELHSSQYVHAKGDGALGQFHFVWPNLKINVYPGRPNVSIGPVWPEGPERTAGFLDYFFAEGEDESWIRDVVELDDQVGREDTALVARVQRGVRSGALDSGTLLGESERLIAHFDRLVREALAD